jgi:hypothetical protein
LDSYTKCRCNFASPSRKEDMKEGEEDDDDGGCGRSIHIGL